VILGNGARAAETKVDVVVFFKAVPFMCAA
jgi:hypothetical protein